MNLFLIEVLGFMHPQSLGYKLTIKSSRRIEIPSILIHIHPSCFNAPRLLDLQ
jgi:hypothetical protein